MEKKTERDHIENALETAFNLTETTDIDKTKTFRRHTQQITNRINNLNRDNANKTGKQQNEQ